MAKVVAGSQDAPPSTYIQALYQLLQKPVTAPSSAAKNREHQLQSLPVPGTLAISLFPTLQLRVWPPDSKAHHYPSLQFFGGKDTLRDNLDCIPYYKQQVKTPTGLKKVTEFVIQR